MEHLDLYIYLILGGLYILSRILKGSNKTLPPKLPSKPSSNTPDDAQTSQNPRPDRPFSFEDLFKEFEDRLGEQQPKKQPVPVQEEIKPVKQKQDELTRQIETPSTYPTYEGSSLEDIFPMYPSGSLMTEKFERDTHYARREEIISDYIKMLREPHGIRKAIVLSEIINRKYF